MSAGEAQALEEAAEMLDERRLPAGTLPTVATPPAQNTAETGDPTELAGDDAE